MPCGCGVQAEWRSHGAGGSKAADCCDKRGHLVFKGVRARVGMFHGEVVKIVPHSRTGEEQSKAVPQLHGWCCSCGHRATAGA
jgi:hypothetical protein